MAKMNGWRSAKITLAAIASAALLAGCASNGTGSSNEGSEGPQSGAARLVGDQGDGGEIQTGGTLRYAAYSMPAQLDPAKTQVAGTTGGTEMASIYDMLIRYDTDTNSFQPQLAKSMEESEDRLSWTLKLRDGVTFSDGTPLTAKAVVASIDRFNTNRGGNAQMYTDNVEKTEATDAATVEFTLTAPWTAFPAIFTFGHGMIVAPSSDGADGTFTPIGAGPFTLGTFTPPETITLEAREDYWDGKPNLDAINIVPIQGDQPKIDTLKSGGVDMIYLRSASTVSDAKDEFAGFFDPFSMGRVVQINQREGKPGSDVRVRQAIAYALDPDLLDERAEDGEGMPGSEIFQPWSEWHSDVPGIQTDPAKATELLDEAKADGFSGEMTYLAISETNSQATATAIQAQLNAVGFNITIDNVASVTDMVKKLYVDKDFDLGFSATALFDASPELRLFSAIGSTSTNNINGVNSPEIDAALTTIQSAATHPERLQAFADLQTLFNEQVPVVNLGATSAFIGWQDSVYGVNPSIDGILLLGKAWVKK